MGRPQRRAGKPPPHTRTHAHAHTSARAKARTHNPASPPPTCFNLLGPPGDPGPHTHSHAPPPPPTHSPPPTSFNLLQGSGRHQATKVQGRAVDGGEAHEVLGLCVWGGCVWRGEGLRVRRGAHEVLGLCVCGGGWACVAGEGGGGVGWGVTRGVGVRGGGARGRRNQGPPATSLPTPPPHTLTHKPTHSPTPTRRSEASKERWKAARRSLSPSMFITYTSKGSASAAYSLYLWVGVGGWGGVVCVWGGDVCVCVCGVCVHVRGGQRQRRVLAVPVGGWVGGMGRDCWEPLVLAASLLHAHLRPPNCPRPPPPTHTSTHPRTRRGTARRCGGPPPPRGHVQPPLPA